MVQIKWSERTAEQVFGQGRLVKWLKSIFATKNHTHTKSEITDFPHTHTLSEISDLTDTGWVAFPFNSNASTDSSSPMYCRRLGKMVTIQGIGRLTNTLSGNSSIAIGYVVLGTEPSITVASPWTGNNQQGYIIIDTEGKVTLYNRNGSSGTMAANSYFIINCTYMID